MTGLTDDDEESEEAEEEEGDSGLSCYSKHMHTYLERYVCCFIIDGCSSSVAFSRHCCVNFCGTLH